MRASPDSQRATRPPTHVAHPTPLPPAHARPGGVVGATNYYVNMLQVSNSIALWLGIEPPDLFLYAVSVCVWWGGRKGGGVLDAGVARG